MSRALPSEERLRTSPRGDAAEDGEPSGDPREAVKHSFRGRLGASLASAAGPYGYTISLGGSIALATGQLGSPHLGGALLLMLGAVGAFTTLGTLAHGTLVPSEPLRGAPPLLWANAHVPSAGLALCAVWGADHVVGGDVGWLVTGFAATGVYLLVCAVQQLAVQALRREQ